MHTAVQHRAESNAGPNQLDTKPANTAAASSYNPVCPYCPRSRHIRHIRSGTRPNGCCQLGPARFGALYDRRCMQGAVKEPNAKLRSASSSLVSYARWESGEVGTWGGGNPGSVKSAACTGSAFEDSGHGASSRLCLAQMSFQEATFFSFFFDNAQTYRIL
ncbi:hypothetical protein EJ07DRAFT_156879 [Lizonia empirigonia]|nr:hypothetical protein EJ07DRAFT_156879 [Lizonia empirigonia]